MVAKSGTIPRFNRVPLEAPFLSDPGEARGELHFFHSAQNADGTQRRILSRITAALAGS